MKLVASLSCGWGVWSQLCSGVIHRSVELSEISSQRKILHGTLTSSQKLYTRSLLSVFYWRTCAGFTICRGRLRCTNLDVVGQEELTKEMMQLTVNYWCCREIMLWYLGEIWGRRCESSLTLLQGKTFSWTINPACQFVSSLECLPEHS